MTNHKARMVLARTKNRPVAAKGKQEPPEKDVYGADARSERASRVDPGCERWTQGLKIPIVMGFQRNEVNHVLKR